MKEPNTIGLLGGSFNPAHSGHVHISLYALRALGLREVWWLVSPQNPLKPAGGMAEYAERFAGAEAITAPHRRRIKVSGFEQQHGLRYTADTIQALQKRYPRARFVWLMGADNLAHFHRWQRWWQILLRVPVVVFDRAPYSHNSLRSKAWIRSRRLPQRLTFLHLPRDGHSSTAIRKDLEKTRI